MATSSSHLVSANTTNATTVKNAPGFVYGYEIGNNSGTTDCYVKLYDKASAPAPASDVPLRVVYVPKGTSVRFTGSEGLIFLNGISFLITGALANTDTTAVAAAAVVVSIEYR